MAATHGYNGTGQRTSFKDRLGQTASAAYDVDGPLKQSIDRKGQLTSKTYDALTRIKHMGFGATATAPTAFKSVVEYTWDKGNRVELEADMLAEERNFNRLCATSGSR